MNVVEFKKKVAKDIEKCIVDNNITKAVFNIKESRYYKNIDLFVSDWANNLYDELEGWLQKGYDVSYSKDSEAIYVESRARDISIDPYAYNPLVIDTDTDNLDRGF